MSPKLIVLVLLITAVSASMAQICDIPSNIDADDVTVAYTTLFTNNGLRDPTPVDPTLGPKVLLKYLSCKFSITNFSSSTINVPVAQIKAAFDSILVACCSVATNSCKGGDVLTPPDQEDPDLDFSLSYLEV